MTVRLLHGDCVEVMATLEPESVHAIVTDPPYGLGFMGKEWDSPGSFVERKPVRSNRFDHVGGNHNPTSSRDAARTALVENRRAQEWHQSWAEAAYRVALPGAHLLAFGGTRTFHRLACAIEDAGWEIRDCLVWGYASGFPKSLDVSKAIDKAAGAEREPDEYTGANGLNEVYGANMGGGITTRRGSPATPEAAEWQGFGTALKPAWEPIILARKPLRGTVAANVLAFGVGALDIDGTRIPSDSRRHIVPNYRPGDDGQFPQGSLAAGETTLGRWPANVVLTDPIFDGGWEGVEGGGETHARGNITPTKGGAIAGYLGRDRQGDFEGPVDPGDSGTYSRFFLIPKAGRAEREAGTEALETREVEWGVTQDTKRRTTHPTVKPLALMSHLVRLVSRPGQTVLDPFLGSGTTAVAALASGRSCIGIDQDADYLAIARNRLRLLAPEEVA